MPDALPLRLGPLSQGDFPIHRSGIRWLCADGQPFRQGDVIGYCNITLSGESQGQGDFYSLDVERWDFQVALIARIAGRLRHMPTPRDGGWHDRQAVFGWSPDKAVATIEPLSDPSPAEAAQPVRFLFLAGRRACELAEDRSGMLTGWHDRSRAWREGAHGAGDGPWGTVLGLGICELHTVMRGERGDFSELLGGVKGPVHAIQVPDQPVVHSAGALIEQLRRTPEESQALASAFSQPIVEDAAGITPADWAFAALSLQALRRSPASERYDLLTSTGVTTVGPADAIIMSVNAEAPWRLRHRQLGFHFDCHVYRLRRLSQAMRNWFERTFEWVPHGIDDVRRDYLELARLLREGHPGRQILVLNAMSTLVGEDILSYDAFEPPLGLNLRGVRARELNAMLHDLAAEADIAVVDADAIAGELGVGICIPDGVHNNGAMQQELRGEILSILHARKVPGFAPMASENLEVHGEL